SIVADQLQYALDYRVVIERAVGYLMGTHHLDAVTAFDMLRRRARDSRRRVADVATEILGGSTGPASDDRVGDLPPSGLGRAGLAAARRFPLLHRVALAAGEPAQAWRVYGDRTLRATLARLRPMASPSPARCFASAVIAWAGHRHAALANRRQHAVPALMP